jgi:uncharacterized protein (TIGR03086 family)
VVVPEQLVRALDGFEAVVNAVPADGWDAPSPCDGWSAAGVVDHLTVGLRAIASLATDGNSAADAAPADGGSPAGAVADGRPASGADLLKRWRAARAALATALDDEALARSVSLPWGARMPLGEYVGRYPLELVVHTWDLAEATGQTPAIDADLVHDALTTAVHFAPAARAAGLIGPERTVAEGAADLTRLVALFGRRPT